MNIITDQFGVNGSLPWKRWLATTLIIAAVAFLASPNGPLGGFWLPSADIPPPTTGQLPFFVLLNAIEVLTFGFGVAFVMYGRPLLAALKARSGWLGVAAFWSVAWLLVSWWPHDSLHIATGVHTGHLLLIEYGFHVTLMFAGAILAMFLFTTVRVDQRA